MTDVGEFTDRAAKECGRHLIAAKVLAELYRQEKENRPRKKCRRPPKYV